MATPFETALSSGQTAVVGYAEDALPVVAAVAVAFLGIKWVRRILRGL